MARIKDSPEGATHPLWKSTSPRAEDFVDSGETGGLVNDRMSAGVTRESLGLEWFERLSLGVDEPVLPAPAGAASPAPIRAARPVRVLLSLQF